MFPFVSDGWSAGTVGSQDSAFTTSAALDAHVVANASAAPLGAALGSSSTLSPPAANALPRWNSTGLFIQTRPVGNDYLLLMARLRNGTGSNVTHLTVSYDWDQKVAGLVGEQIPGHRTFYSGTGLPGSWTLVPELSTFANESTAQRLNVTLPAGKWTNGADFFLLWADDNSTGTEGAYTIDNFSVSAVPATTPVILQQPVSQSVVLGGNLSLSVDAFGAVPLFFQWRRDEVDIPLATNQSFSINGVQSEDTGSYSIVVSNAFGVVTSSPAMLAVGCLAPVSITTQPQGQVLTPGGTVALSVAAAGTQPLTFQWYRGGLPLPGATNQSLIQSNAFAADSGQYHVLVSNCVGAVASAAVLVRVPDAPLTLMGLTNHFWRYEQSGADLGALWRGTNYDDSAWPLGRGVLAQESLAALNPLTNTVLWLTPPGGSLPLATYYFRTAFSFTNDLAEVVVVASNYIDDGAIFYLNGQEAFRYNLPTGEVLNSTLALAANPLGEGNYIVSNLPPHLLRSGQNIIAVEVHQSSLTSSDVAFGMSLIVVPLLPTLLQLTNQPLNLTVAEGQPASFAVGVAGTVVHYQWYKDGVAIPGATASTLGIPAAQASDGATYFAVASNALNSVTSRVAALVVNLDAAPPVLLAADHLDPTHVLVTFSEPVLEGGAVQLANYQLTNTAGGVAAVLSAALTNGTNVLLTTTPLLPDVNYILTARGMADASPSQNALAPSAVPVARTWSPAPLLGDWHYFEPFPPFTAAEPGPGWNLPGLDLTEWGYDLAAFAYSQSLTFIPPVPVQTVMVVSPSLVSYFRTEFLSPASPAGLSVWMRHAVEDGALFFLNGVEVQRFNLPGGVVGVDTPAATNLSQPLLTGWVPLPSSALPPGSNLFAAQLHQSAPNAGQKMFAAELKVRSESLLTGPILVLAGPQDVLVQERQPATFRVSVVGATAVQWQVNDTDWPGATNDTLEFIASAALDGVPVRCVCFGPGGPVVTPHATPRVLPDLTRPVLLGAVGTADGVVVLKFSEPLDSVTAQQVGNYAITNRFGVSVPVVSAGLVQGSNVWLTPGAWLADDPIVVVNGVMDRAALPNAVAPGSAARIGLDVLLPFEASWKYLLINTNATVQSTFMLPGYDDSLWLVGQGALQNEPDAVPVAKGTLLPFFDESGANRINTYYFRKSVVLPLTGTGMVVQVRHVVDDGMVLHVNGIEAMRFNIAAGTVTAATQAAAFVDNAATVGPLLLPAAYFTGGTNVLAVDVHQQGAQSSDVVMGLELRFTAPTELLPVPPLPAPRLESRRVGGELILHWGDPGYLVEQSPTLTGLWQPLSTVSPVVQPLTNGPAFFRLRR